MSEAAFIATMRAKRTGRGKAHRGNGAGRPDLRGAIIYLRQAEHDYLARVRDGRLKAPDRAHTLLTLARQALEDPR